MKCSFCTRRQFLKISAAAAASAGFFSLPCAHGLSAAIPEELRINVTARCIFSSLVVTAEDQKTFPNPYRKDLADSAIAMNDDCSGVNKGLEAVLSGKADIGTICRELTAEEKAAGIVQTRLDSLPYSVIVNKNSPVAELSLEQVLKIFAGQIQNWKEVGGKDKEILIYRQECGAGYDWIMDQAIEKAGIKKNPDRLKEAVMSVEITDNQFEKTAALDMVITMAPCIFWDAQSRALKISGMLPLEKNSKNPDWPFLAPVSLVSRKDSSPAVQKYLAFMTGPKGRELVEKSMALDWLRQGF
ncbi:MAG: substrate-binding domain-containing protein [Desulfobacterales bacterium]